MRVLKISEVAKKYNESDDNLNRLWKLILANKDIEKKYLILNPKDVTNRKTC